MNRKLISMLLLAAWALCLSACGGTSTNIGADSGLPEPGADLASSGSTDTAILEGVINVLDFTAPAAPPPSSGTSGVRGGSAAAGSGLQIMARIINPGDDILSSVLTKPGQRYTLSVGSGRVSATSPLSTSLEVSFKVAEDVTGDGKGGDTITQTVPINLLGGKKATLNITISRGSASAADPASIPDVNTGQFVFAQTERNDALGDKSDFSGTDYANGQVYFDVDGNEFLRPGDDQVALDANKNGWPDDTENSYFDPVVNPPSAPNASVAGIITSVDLAALTFEMTTDTGAALHVNLDPHALIVPLGSNGELLGQIVFDSSLVGRHASLDYIPLDAANGIALRVVVDDKPVGK